MMYESNFTGAVVDEGHIRSKVIFNASNALHSVQAVLAYLKSVHPKEMDTRIFLSTDFGHGNDINGCNVVTQDTLIF